MGPLSLMMSAAATLLAAAPAPSFSPNYAEAIAQAQQQHKPVAVFLGKGADGLAKLVTEGVVPTSASAALQSEFICLYVDTTTDAGRKLAGNFEMTEGLVISDRDGAKQVLRHGGSIPAEALATYTATYATPNLSAAQTIYAGSLVTPVVAAQPTTYSPAPVYQPAPAMYAPAPIYRAAPSFGYPAMGGCASGRCPNAR